MNGLEKALKDRKVYKVDVVRYPCGTDYYYFSSLEKAEKYAEEHTNPAKQVFAYCSDIAYELDNYIDDFASLNMFCNGGFVD